MTLVPGGAVGYADTDRGDRFWAGSLAVFVPLSKGIQCAPAVTVLRPPGDDADWHLLGGLGGRAWGLAWSLVPRVDDVECFGLCARVLQNVENEIRNAIGELEMIGR